MNKLKSRPDLMVMLFIILFALLIVALWVSSYTSAIPVVKNF
ncbi:MAG TPA: hypothetical protein VH186_31000 [Chloroflexia bacterium]|nr:hypothetical protein [Chloroflexia bacterium]